MNTDFEVTHKELEGKHFLTFSPKKKSSGFPPKEIEVTQEQWEGLKYHFATGVDDKNKVSVLAYL